MPKKRLIICVVTFLLVAIPLTAATAYRKIQGAAPASEETIQEEASVPQGLLFELRPSGFIPSETEVSSGNYMLLLQNRSGGKDLNFTLERENQGRVAASPERRRDWAAKVRLAPGTYILREVDHPEWTAVIRVTPR